MPSAPQTEITIPIIRKSVLYPTASTSIPNPPATLSIAARGSIESTPSTVPRNEDFVLSVTQELKLASFAAEPKSVITQSPTITRVSASLTAASPSTPKSADIVAGDKNPKSATVIPQIIYPMAIKERLFPDLSESVPAISVTTVAVIPES